MYLGTTKKGNNLKNNTAIVCLSPNSGGMELDSIKLAKKLMKYTKVTLVAQENKFVAKKSFDYINTKDVTLETIKFKSSMSFSIIFRMREIIKKYDIKNVIFFGASELKSLYFAFLGFNINLIVRHGTTKSTPKKDWFHKLIYSKVNYHVSICKHLEKNVKYIIPFGKESQSTLIYPSVELENMKKGEHSKLTLLHIGRITNGKGQIDAIKACSILYEKKIDFVFYIVGEFEEDFKEEFRHFYNSIEYKDKIKLVGFTKDINAYLAKSDIFLFPSHGEGFGNSFLEALNAELICISYLNTSFYDFRDLDFYFHQTEDKNIEHLKNTLLNVVLNLDNEKEKSVKNSKIVKNLFLEENEVSQYLKILE